VCTAPKNRGGGGAEDDVNLNAAAVAAHRLKAFLSGGATAPRFSFHQGRRGRAAGRQPSGRLMISVELFSRSFLQTCWTNMESECSLNNTEFKRTTVYIRFRYILSPF